MYSNDDVVEEGNESSTNESRDRNKENGTNHNEFALPRESNNSVGLIDRTVEDLQGSREASASSRHRAERLQSPGSSISATALPLIDITRRLSLQVSTPGSAVSRNHSIPSDENAETFNSLLRTIPIDTHYANKLPGGSRYFVSPLEDTSRRNSSISHISHSHDAHPITQRPPSAFSLNDESHRRNSAISDRPQTSHLNRNIRTARNRPVSSTTNHIQTTERRRNPSAKCKLPAYSVYNIDFYHLPPGGPDCYPGCGYSGLPCYVCSTKHLNEDLQGSELSTRSSIFTVLQPTHQSRGQQTFSPNFSDEPPITRCQAFFKPCSLCCHECMNRIRSRIHLPNSRLKQLGLTCFIVYLLLIIHIGVTRLLRDYHL